jgi:nucleoside-diphosphate-sugar epimerase
MSDAATCLVTGAAGFIGRRLCAVLGEGECVRALLRTHADGPWRQHVVADLASNVPVDAAAGVETIYHLAARTHAVDEIDGDEEAYRRINVDATRALREAAREYGVRRFVFVSSVKALGEGGTGVTDDSSEPRPTSAYGRTKLEAERLVLDGGYVPEPAVIRSSLVYGPGMKGNLVNMLSAIDAGRFPPPPPVDNRRTMVHVDDVVTALIAAARSGTAAGRAWIISDGRHYSTREIYESMCRALDQPARRGLPLAAFRLLALAGDFLGMLSRRRAPFDSAAFDKLFGSACYDGSRIWGALGETPRWSLDTAMPDIVAAYRA